MFPWIHNITDLSLTEITYLKGDGTSFLNFEKAVHMYNIHIDLTIIGSSYIYTKMKSRKGPAQNPHLNIITINQELIL